MFSEATGFGAPNCAHTLATSDLALPTGNPSPSAISWPRRPLLHEPAPTGYPALRLALHWLDHVEHCRTDSSGLSSGRATYSRCSSETSHSTSGNFGAILSDRSGAGRLDGNDSLPSSATHPWPAAEKRLRSSRLSDRTRAIGHERSIESCAEKKLVNSSNHAPATHHRLMQGVSPCFRQRWPRGAV